MLLSRFFDRRRRERVAHQLYTEVMALARQPGFFAEWGVPDSVDGRFDMLVLHAYLLLRRLGAVDGAAAAPARALSQAVFDLMFADMDQNLREMGVSDLAVGNKIRAMVEAFYGRVAAYDAGLAESDDVALAAALGRNIYREAPPTPMAPVAMAAYLRRQAAQLDRQPIDALMAGSLSMTAGIAGAP